jgi:hypothetical protein
MQLPFHPLLQELSMSVASDNKYPDISIFPDLNIVIRTPVGREYRGKVLEHPSQHADGESWLQVQFLDGASKDDAHAVALLKQRFRKSGRPDYFPAESRVEPLDVAFNRIPAAKRTDRNADTLIGELWDTDGLWTLLVKPSKADRLLHAGSVLPSQAEIANPSSTIAKFQRPARPDEVAVDANLTKGGLSPRPKG